MTRFIPTIVLAVISLSVMCGCQKTRKATFEGQPQAEHQKPKDMKGRVEHLVVMLNLEESHKKNLKAARLIGEAGADGADALPALEEAAENHEFEDVREAAKKSIEQIKAAQAGEAAPSEGE